MFRPSHTLIAFECIAVLPPSVMVLFGFWINLEDQSANIHPDTSIPSVTVEQQPAGRLHRQGARPPDGEQEVGAEEGDRGGGAGGLEGGGDRLLLFCR